MARSPAAPVESLGSFFAGARCTGAQHSCSRWRLPPATGGWPPFVEPAARPSLDLPGRAIRLRLDRPTVRGRSARKRERSHRAAEPRAAGPGGARWWPYFAWATPKQALCQRPYGRAGARSGAVISFMLLRERVQTFVSTSIVIPVAFDLAVLLFILRTIC